MDIACFQCEKGPFLSAGPDLGDSTVFMSSAIRSVWFEFKTELFLIRMTHPMCRGNQSLHAINAQSATRQPFIHPTPVVSSLLRLISSVDTHRTGTRNANHRTNSWDSKGQAAALTGKTLNGLVVCTTLEHDLRSLVTARSASTVSYWWMDYGLSTTNNYA